MKKSILFHFIILSTFLCSYGQVTLRDFIGLALPLNMDSIKNPYTGSLDFSQISKLDSLSSSEGNEPPEMKNADINTEASSLAAVIPSGQILHPHIPNSFTVDTSKDIGEIPYTATVTPSGSMQVSVPFDIPENPRGFTPTIGLVYNSLSGNGIAGKGWNINGLSSIQATPSNLYYDNHVEGIPAQLSNADNAFVLDGIRLIRTQVVPDKVSYISETGNIKAEGYIRTSGQNRYISYFMVYFPDGRTGKYGYSNASDPLGGVGLFYPVTEMRNMTGDIITYYYTAINNNYRIDKITYGANQPYSVQFNYVTRPDIQIRYEAGLEITCDYLLSGISTSFAETGLKNYELAYIQQDHVSILSTVSLAVPGRSLNPLRFYYGENNSLNSLQESGNTQLTNWYNQVDKLRVAKGKFEYGSENDGLITLPNKVNYNIHSFLQAQSVGGIPVFINYCLLTNQYDGTEDIFIVPTTQGTYTIPNILKTGNEFRDILCADIDNIPGEEIIKVNNYIAGNFDRLTFEVYISDLFYGLVRKYTRTYDFSTLINYNNTGIKSINPKYYFTGDFTGNGKIEVLAVSANNIMGQGRISECYLFDLENNEIIYQGNNFNFNISLSQTGLLNISPEEAEKSSDKIFIIDYDSDGKSDICLINSNGTYIYSFNGSSFVQKMSSNILTRNILIDKNLLLGDLNGDGKTDLLLSPSVGNGNLWKIYSMTGGGIAERSLPITIKNENEKFFLQDMDGDGQADLISVRGDSHNTTLCVFFLADYDYRNYASYSVQDPNITVVPTNISSRNYFDKLLSINNNGIVKKYTYPHSKPKNTLLSGIVSSYGIVTKIGHQQLNEVSDLFSDYIYRSGYGAVFPFQNYDGGYLVVNKTETWHNNVKIKDNYFTYENAVIHRQGLGFRGFEKVETYDGLSTDYNYKTYDPFNFSVLIKEETRKTLVNNVYTITVAPNKEAKILLSTSEQTDKLNNNTYQFTYSYDTYGNWLTKKTDFAPGISRTLSRQLLNLQQPYILGIPTQESEINTRNGSAMTRKKVLTYNSVYLPLSITSFYNTKQVSEEEFIYDAAYNITEKKHRRYFGDWLNSTYEYDNYGRIIKETDPFGLAKEYTYNTSGLIATTKNHRNNTDRFEYDVWGRIKKVIHPAEVQESISYVWDNSAGAVYYMQKTSSNYPNTRTFIDASGQVVREGEIRFDGIYMNTDYVYNRRGLLEKVSLPFKSANAVRWNMYTYDVYDRLKEVAYASGKKDRYTYSANKVSETIDGITTVREYESTGNLLNASGIMYIYRPDGQLSTIVASGGPVYLRYDEFGRINQFIDQSLGTHNYTYNPNGYLASESVGILSNLYYTFDKYGRLLKKENTSAKVEYFYDSENQLIREENERIDITRQYTYDAYGRLSSEKELTDNGSKRFIRSYIYGGGKLSRIIYQDEEGEIAHEVYRFANGHVSKVLLDETTRLWELYQENDGGQPTTVITGPVYRAYMYDPYGYLIQRYTTGGTQYMFQNFSYTWDPQTGNLLSRKDNKRNITETFVYDESNRLSEYSGKTVSYDTKGNITYKSDIGSYSYGLQGNPYAVSEIVSAQGALPQHTHQVSYRPFIGPRIIKENTYSATIDLSGDGSRRKMELKNNNVVELTRRYYSDRYETDETASGTEKRLYLYGDAYTAPAVYIKNGSENWRLYYIFRDYMGSITHLSTSGGVLAQELSYDAWGRLRNPSNQEVYQPGHEPALKLGRGYTGHEHLPQLGLIHMNARLYDPAVGRFFSPDPYVQNPEVNQNYNRYSYCLNNPFKYRDQSGKSYDVSYMLKCLSYTYDFKIPVFDYNTYYNNTIAPAVNAANSMNTSYSPPAINTGSNYYTPSFSTGNVVSADHLSGFSLDYLRKINAWQPSASDHLKINKIVTNGYSGILSVTEFANNGIGGLGTGLESLNGSFRLSKGGEFSPKYYESNWQGGSRAKITTYNAATWGNRIAKGSLITSISLGSYNIINGYIADEGSFGYNTQVAAGEAVGGIVGSWAGAKTGAAIGISIGSYFGPPGIISGAVIGGTFGGFLGGMGGAELGRTTINMFY